VVSLIGADRAPCDSNVTLVLALVALVLEWATELCMIHLPAISTGAHLLAERMRGGVQPSQVAPAIIRGALSGDDGGDLG